VWVEHVAEEAGEVARQLRRGLVEQPEEDVDVARFDAKVRG
jgi:hypothetical protein